jgi:hypothetical protein
MDMRLDTPPSPVLEAGTLVIMQYCPPDRDFGRVTRTIDLQAHARQFRRTYRESRAAGAPDLHHGRVGDAWAAELITSGIVEILCTKEDPCAAHDDWMVEPHDYDVTLNIYPDSARLGHKDALY